MKGMAKVSKVIYNIRKRVNQHVVYFLAYLCQITDESPIS